jgi:hypothetical protein
MKTTYQLSRPSTTFSLGQRINLSLEKLESYRIFILLGAMLWQACVVVPALLLVSSFNDIGLADISMATALIGMVAALVSNLSEAGLKLALSFTIVNNILAIILIAIHL